MEDGKRSDRESRPAGVRVTWSGVSRRDLTVKLIRAGRPAAEAARRARSANTDRDVDAGAD